MDSHVARSVAWSGRTLLSVAGALLSAVATAQGQRQIAGRVVDVDGNNGVSGAAVTVTGTTLGAVTNDSGVFRVRVPSGPATLNARRIGFKPRSVSVDAAQTDVTIALTKDVLQLEATIVTGAATSISSRNSAIAVTNLDAQEVNRVPAPTVENALQAKVPGALIEQNNGGAPGGGLQVQIRGITSINANAQPLYVLDGVVLDNGTTNNDLNAISAANSNNVGVAPDEQDNSPNRIADLNPEDIESIEVLKGSSASAIYGSRAASGVIIITTKRGTPGRAKWFLAEKLGTFEQAKSMPLLRFSTLASAQTWAANYTSLSPATVASRYSGNHDFQADLFGNRQLANETDLSVRGATDQTQYFASALTKYDNGIMLNTGYNKQAIRSNLTQSFSSSISASANVYFAHDLTRRGFTGNDNIGGSPYAIFSYTPQFYNLDQKRNGVYVTNPFGPANVFEDAFGIQTPEEVTRFIAGGNLTWKVIQADRQTLTLTGLGGADLSSQRDNLYAPPDLQIEASQHLPGVSTTQNATTNLVNYSLNAVHRYAGGTNFDATTSIGFTRDKSNYYNPSTVGQFLLAGQNSPTVGSVTNTFYTRTAVYNQSVYAQEQLITLAERLTVTAGVTGERSTNDGSRNKYFLFPKYSAAFRVPHFLSWLDELKLRGAYGKSGTLPNYGVQYTTFPTQVISGLTGLYPSELLGDPNITPETNTEIETGFDATMFNSRLAFSATVYQKRITDLLLQANLAPSGGQNSQWINGGQFTNHGIELSLDVTPIQLHNGFSWVSTNTFFRNYSRVDALPVPAFQEGSFFGGPYGAFRVQVGRSVSQVTGTVCTGGDVTTGNCTGSAIQNFQVGDAQPAFQMGFGNTFSLRSVHLYFLLDYRRGGVVGNLTNNYFDGPHLLADTAASTKREAYLATGFACFGGFCPYVEFATYLKLREVTLGYDLPDDLVKRVGFSRLTSARLQVSGRNLWWSYTYSGLDPEVSVFGAQNITRAQDVTPYPPARSIFFSLSLGF